MFAGGHAAGCLVRGLAIPESLMIVIVAVGRAEGVLVLRGDTVIQVDDRLVVYGKSPETMDAFRRSLAGNGHR